MTTSNNNNNNSNSNKNVVRKTCPYCNKMETRWERRDCKEAYEWAKAQIKEAERGVLYCGPQAEYYIDN